MNSVTLGLAAALLVAVLAPKQSSAQAVPSEGAADGKIVATGSRPEENFRDCADCPEMVAIPAGEFTMGAPAGELGRYDEEGPQRHVQVRRFAASKFDVTRGQWALFVAATNRATHGGCSWSGLPGGEPDAPNPVASWSNLGFMQEDSHPVVCVTWNDAQDYLHWLNDRTGHAYRLLSEAEWEYAARAGSTTSYPWGESASHEHANYGAEECCSGLSLGRDQWKATSPVGSFPPNAYGLYDMNGNAMTWVQDCFASSYAGLPTDGSAYVMDVTLEMSGEMAILNGSNSCSYRLLRGGNFGDPSTMIRSAARNFAPPPGSTLADYSSSGLGIRIARALD